VKAEEGLLQQMLTAFKTYDQHLSLGRYEDLLRIDEVSLVSIKETDEVELKHAVYIPKHFLNRFIRGVPYRLNWIYNIKNNIREWIRIPVLYVEGKKSLFEDDFIKSLIADQNGYPIFWNE